MLGFFFVPVKQDWINILFYRYCYVIKNVNEHSFL